MARNWRPAKLRWKWFTFNLAAQLALLVLIIVLSVLSSKRNGLWTVSFISITSIRQLSLSAIRNSQFRWTLPPAIYTALIGLGYGSIVSSTSERQPYVELYRDSKAPSTAKKTIMLEYPTYSMVYSWGVAFKNGHYLLFSSMLLQLIVSLVLTSVAANLFRADPSQSQSDIVLGSTDALNLSLASAGLDLQAAINLASGINVYGASPPSWMTNIYAIESFSPDADIKAGNLTINTTAYYVIPSCRRMRQDELQLSPGPGQLSAAFTDRGCHVSASNIDFPLDPSTPYYARTWYQECNYTDDRIGIYAGVYSATEADHMQNLSIISCQPEYWNASITLKASVQSDGDPAVVSVQVNNQSWLASSPLIGKTPSFRQLHGSLPYYTTFDASDTFNADAFGRTVFDYGQKLSPQSSVDPDVMANAMEIVYTTFFAAFATTRMMQVPTTPKQMPATLFTANMRLYIDVPVTCTMLPLLTWMILCTVSMFIYSYTRGSILREEPLGLLGRARLVANSDILQIVTDFDRAYANKDGMIDYMRKHYSVKKGKAYFDEHRDKPIVVEDFRHI